MFIKFVSSVLALFCFLFLVGCSGSKGSNETSFKINNSTAKSYPDSQVLIKPDISNSENKPVYLRWSQISGDVSIIPSNTYVYTNDVYSFTSPQNNSTMDKTITFKVELSDKPFDNNPSIVSSAIITYTLLSGYPKIPSDAKFFPINDNQVKTTINNSMINQIKDTCLLMFGSNSTSLEGVTCQVSLPSISSDVCGYPTESYYIKSYLNTNPSDIRTNIIGDCGGLWSDRYTKLIYKNDEIPNGIIGGYFNKNNNPKYKDFPSSIDASMSLYVINNIIKSGRIPVFSATHILFDNNNNLRPDAEQRLKNSVAKFPNVFNDPKLLIEVQDEPYWNLGKPLEIDLNKSINETKQALALVRKYVPTASIGIVFVSLYNQNPTIKKGMIEVMPLCDWVSVDPYAFNSTEYSDRLNETVDFTKLANEYSPNAKKYLIIQGFGPLDINEWNNTNTIQYEDFLGKMFDYSVTYYDGAIMFGWTDGNGDIMSQRGMYYPKDLKEFIINKINSLY